MYLWGVDCVGMVLSVDECHHQIGCVVMCWGMVWYVCGDTWVWEVCRDVLVCVYECRDLLACVWCV